MWTLAAECMLSLRYALTSVRWWEKAEELFGLTNLYPPRMIETERGHSGSPDRCATNHPVSVPTKMFVPVIHTLMKQRHLVSRVRVHRCNAVGFM
jgi:hypothetical protein